MTLSLCGHQAISKTGPLWPPTNGWSGLMRPTCRTKRCVERFSRQFPQNKNDGKTSPIKLSKVVWCLRLIANEQYVSSELYMCGQSELTKEKQTANSEAKNYKTLWCVTYFYTFSKRKSESKIVWEWHIANLPRWYILTYNNVNTLIRLKCKFFRFDGFILLQFDHIYTQLKECIDLLSRNKGE